jgi:hypothetical protein
VPGVELLLVGRCQCGWEQPGGGGGGCGRMDG